MSHQYLLMVHERIEEHENEARELMEKSSDKNETAYQEGRLSVLTVLDEFLEKNYHKVLPRRIFHKLKAERDEKKQP